MVCPRNAILNDQAQKLVFFLLQHKKNEPVSDGGMKEILKG